MYLMGDGAVPSDDVVGGHIKKVDQRVLSGYTVPSGEKRILGYRSRLKRRRREHSGCTDGHGDKPGRGACPSKRRPVDDLLHGQESRVPEETHPGANRVPMAFPASRDGSGRRKKKVLTIFV